MDGERLFKISMATLLLGQVESRGGTAAEWEEQVKRWVPYHPAARLPEQKLSRPETFKPPGPALDGELGLVQHLAELGSVPARVRYMYEEAEAGLDARMADPTELGPDWDLSSFITRGITWESVAAWTAEDRRVPDAISAQLPARWFATPGAIGAALADEIGAVQVLAEDLIDAVEREAPGRHERLVIVACGDDAVHVLDRLVEAPGLRDRMLAFVAVGAPLWGREDGADEFAPGVRRDWMDAAFRHEVLDTEAMRMTPYCALQWLDPMAETPGAFGVGLQNARFGPPKGHTDALRIESVDLGPVPVGIDEHLLARALILTVSVLVLSKR